MSASLLARLIEAGTPAELIGEVALLVAKAGQLEERRAAERDRKRRSRDVTGQGVTGRDTPLDGPPPSPQTPLPPPLNPPTPSPGECVRVNPKKWPAGYREEFWEMYPNKVGKPDAKAKFQRLAQATGSLSLSNSVTS